MTASISRTDTEIPFQPKNISISHYTTHGATTKPPASLIFAHGASGSMHTPAVLHFAEGAVHSRDVVAFQGNMNLKSRVKQFIGVAEWCSQQTREGSGSLVFGGRSMGARAATIAASEIYGSGEDGKVRKSLSKQLVLVSYPLVAPGGELRDQILLDLDEQFEVLFIIGSRDEMCPLDQLQQVREKMSAKSWFIMVVDANHGMTVRPAALSEAVISKTGREACLWLEKKDEREREGKIWVTDAEGDDERQVKWSGWSSTSITTDAPISENKPTRTKPAKRSSAATEKTTGNGPHSDKKTSTSNPTKRSSANNEQEPDNKRAKRTDLPPEEVSKSKRTKARQSKQKTTTSTKVETRQREPPTQSIASRTRSRRQNQPSDE